MHSRAGTRIRFYGTTHGSTYDQLRIARPVSGQLVP